MNTEYFSGVEFIFNKIAELLKYIYFTYLSDFIEAHIELIDVIFNVLIIIFIVGITFVFIKFREVIKKEREFYSPVDVVDTEVGQQQTQWEIIVNHANSSNSAEWKIAIIEADNILDNILKEVGYEGDTLADRLKAAGDGEAIQDAWDAHKVRNAIAHEGEVELTQRETKRVIALYENVFKKFGYI